MDVFKIVVLDIQTPTITIANHTSSATTSHKKVKVKVKGGRPACFQDDDFKRGCFFLKKLLTLSHLEKRVQKSLLLTLSSKYKTMAGCANCYYFTRQQVALIAC